MFEPYNHFVAHVVAQKVLKMSRRSRNKAPSLGSTLAMVFGGFALVSGASALSAESPAGRSAGACEAKVQKGQSCTAGESFSVAQRDLAPVTVPLGAMAASLGLAGFAATGRKRQRC
jgi:hypothetical protein